MRLRNAVVAGFVCCSLLFAGITYKKWLRKSHYRNMFVGHHAKNSFNKGQCTWYAFDRAKQSGWRLRFDQSYGRNAKDWPLRVVNASLVASPAPGEIMVVDAWPGNPYGHVAYVEEVIDSDHWTVSHANMSVGDAFGVLDGFTIRTASVTRSGSSISFENKGYSLKISGFLSRASN